MNLAENPEALGLGEFLTASDIEIFETMPFEGPCNPLSLDTNRVCDPYGRPFSRRCELGDLPCSFTASFSRHNMAARQNYVLVFVRVLF